MDNLYEDTLDLLNNSNTQFAIVMWDFNEKIGKTEGVEEVTGQFGLNSSNKLNIINTFFKKGVSRKWTWRNLDGMTKNEIDFILSAKPNIFLDIKVINKVNIGNDHVMLLGKIKINTQLEQQNPCEKNQAISMRRNWGKVEKHFNFS